jgi:hypothetical protein
MFSYVIKVSAQTAAALPYTFLGLIKQESLSKSNWYNITSCLNPLVQT